MTDQYVSAKEYQALKSTYEGTLAELRRLLLASRELQQKSYDEGREDARREWLREGSRVEQGDGLAHLTLPGNGGAIQFHVIGPMGARPLTGGMLSPDADFLLRIWGPPDDRSPYGVSEQGGGNATDFSMSFDLTPQGIVIHRMDMTGVRTRWDLADA